MRHALADRPVPGRDRAWLTRSGWSSLVDLESANGTWVDGDPVHRRRLDAADVVTLGESTVSWAFVGRREVRARKVIEEADDELAGPGRARARRAPAQRFPRIRFSRTRTLICTGVPVSGNVSRSFRSRNRR